MKGCRTLESIGTIEINQKLESTARNFQRFRPLKRETISKISKSIKWVKLLARIEENKYEIRCVKILGQKSKLR